MTYLEHTLMSKDNKCLYFATGFVQILNFRGVRSRL